MEILAWVPGPMEIGIIVIVALLIFGRNLPKIAGNIGKSVIEFKKGFKEVKDEADDVTDSLKGEIAELKEIKNETIREVSGGA